MYRKLNSYIDLSHKKDGSETLDEYLSKAKQYNTRCVFVNRFQFDYAKEFLKGTDVIIAGGVNFPLGNESIEAQLADFEDLYKVGFRELEGELNQYAVKNKMYDYIERELAELSIFSNQHGVFSKIILETSEMDFDFLEKVCRMALKFNTPCLKTSTGYSRCGAELDKVKFMKQILGDKVAIKASGGIKTFEQACEFIDAGCCCFGATAIDDIIAQQEEYFKNHI